MNLDTIKILENAQKRTSDFGQNSTTLCCKLEKKTPYNFLQNLQGYIY